uniref:Uncharacterized protein n=1 Tax=Knipowitschia caucasica TaxID=637954 RepID=A0AAV2K2Q4_KNICA
MPCLFSGNYLSRVWYYCESETSLNKLRAMLAETRHQHWSSPDRNLTLDCQRDRTVEYGQQPASSPKSNFLGFEVDVELIWNNWDPGREFTKTLIIKNTQTKLQRTLFRPPLSKYFTSLARQKIVVRPGSSFSVPITFKPLDRCNYEDTVEFQSGFGSFQVTLRAPAPCHALKVPESVLMPLCAAHHSTQTTFVLKNISKLTTFFHWEYSQPFTLSPNEGKLKPGHGLDISVTFHPQEAVVHQQSVSCRFGNQADNLERCCSLLLQGQAKHPYLEFKAHTNQKKGLDHVPVLDFGGAAVGHTLHSHFEIYNPCPVPVCFTLSRLPGGIPLLGSVFRCDVTSAEVAPEAVFQWDVDCSGLSVFSIQPAEGTIPPQSHISLTVVYKPTQTSIHYRRVACLILHMEPVFINLVGNCPIEKPFQQLLESSKVHKHSFHTAATPNAEYFLSCLGGKDPPCSPPLLSVTPNTLAFNQKVFSLPENLSSQKALTITSHSKLKLRLEWTAAAGSSFSVSPLFCELPPRQSTSFRVKYHPKQLNALHGAQLECFAYPMENDEGNRRSVLPSCVTVKVVGHSYEPGRKHSVPRCSLQPCLVEFPPVNMASQRSVLLVNTGDLPLTFDLNSELDQALAQAASLVVVPSCGLVPPQSHQILSLRTIPTEDSPEEGLTVQLHFNASKYTQIIDVCGEGSLSHCSTKELWRLLSLKDLNESLQFSPCPAELTYSTPTRHRSDTSSRRKTQPRRHSPARRKGQATVMKNKDGQPILPTQDIVAQNPVSHPNLQDARLWVTSLGLRGTQHTFPKGRACC